MSFGCRNFFQKTSEVFSRTSALASKMRSNQKIRALCTIHRSPEDIILTLLHYFLIWPLFRGLGRNPGKHFVGFLEEVLKPKGHFEFNWPLVDVTIPDPWTNLIFRFFKIVWSRYPGECFMFYIDWSCMYILSTTFIIHQIRFLLKWICIWLPDNQIILRHWKWRCRTSSKNRYRMMKCSQMGLFKQFWHSVIQRFYYHSDATKCPWVGHFM